VEHDPVLADRVVDLLAPALARGGVVVDATLGRGGHTRRILDSAAGSSVVGIDRDAQAVEATRAELRAYGQRLRVVRDNFAHLAAILERLGIEEVRGVLFDLGVASPQLDAPQRGFSFRHDGPLDMRMDPSGRLTADDVVNRYAERDLGHVIRRYGEERFATRIARAIVKSRPIASTLVLAEVVRSAIPAATRRTGGHPARRTFQAIRIEVNDELGALERALPAAVDALAPGGRLIAISYHSLEDRTVKRFFADEQHGCVCPPEFPVCRCGAEARLRVLTRRPERPGESEKSRNRRASAAKLRAAERVTAEAEPLPQEEKKPA
jgi:16S rRNA (cytosine1402-N4)-methyltransferase